MTDSKLKPVADLKVKIREYEDKETGKMKGVYITVGVLFSSPHGSHQAIKLDSLPVGDWSGWISLFKREEGDSKQSADDPIEF